MVTHPNFLSMDTPLLVGREREQRILLELLAAAQAGRGRLVLVSGEAGIGKTALIEEFVAHVTESGTRIVMGHCHDLTDTPAYGPWYELFQRAAQATDFPPLPIAFAHADGVGPVASQATLFAELRDLLQTATHAQPTLLVLDDMHWSDLASLDLLRYLAPIVQHLPLLLVVVFRTDELRADHPLAHALPALIREVQPIRLPLQRLMPSEIQTLVRARYALPYHGERQLVSMLRARSEGNPFFLTELLHTLEEERLLNRPDDHWELGDLTQVRVPQLLRQVIERRLARLDEESQRLLGLAAVIGDEVPLTLWMAVANVSEEALLTTVESAVAHRIVAETTDGEGVRFVHALTRQTLYERTLAARRRHLHRSVAEVLLALPNPDLDAVAYHLTQARDARAVEWLIRAGQHAWRASAWPVAADRYETARTLLPDTDATASERGWLTFVLARIDIYFPLATSDRLEIAAQLAIRAGDRVLAAVVACYRSLFQFNGGDVRGGITRMRDTVTALQALSGEERATLQARREWIGRALDEDNGVAQLAFFLALSGHLTEARALAEEVLAASSLPTGQLSGMIHGHADALLASAIVAAFHGAPDTARDAIRQAWQINEEHAAYDEAGRVRYVEALWIDTLYPLEDATALAQLQEDLLRTWRKASVSLMPFSSDALILLPLSVLVGDWQTVRQMATELPLGSVTLELIPRSILATIAYHQGDTACVRQLVEEVLPDGPATEPGGTNIFTALILQLLAARAARDAGDTPTARAWIEAHDRWLAWSGAVVRRAASALAWAEEARATGARTRAYQMATAALAYATAPRQPLALLAAHRLLGEIATEERRYADAAEHLKESLILADDCSAPYERALTLLARATLHAAMGEAAIAREMLETVGAICVPLGAQPALARADALARRLGTPTDASIVPIIAPDPPAPPPPQPQATAPGGLTERETAILRLVAEGRSNREIGATLGITVRTAERHVSNIYTKIGIGSRAEAAAFAIRHGLL